MRWSVLVFVAACATRVDRPRATPAQPVAVPAVAITEARVAPITGTHGAPIEILAVANEGDAAISADTHGAIRLWPTLDGTREPIVVHAGVPSKLAIARDGDGFLVANVDVAKGLELIRIDRDGQVRDRVMTRGEATHDVVLIGGVAIVLRVDQAIEILDATGERAARLVPDAGTRIVHLLAVGTRALAIGEGGSARFARWIDVSARSWGATTSGYVMELDRAGRVYTLEVGGYVRVSKGGQPARELPLAGATSIVPDANGARLVVLEPGQISLYLGDGTHVWSTTRRDVRLVRWLGDDLVASFADSLARLDLATGELAARQCGWEFGLHEVALVGGADTRNVCDAD